MSKISSKGVFTGSVLASKSENKKVVATTMATSKIDLEKYFKKRDNIISKFQRLV